METQEPNQNPENSPENSKERVIKTSTNPVVIPVIGEQLSVDKKVVESGRVHITKTVAEEQKTVSIPLNHEEVLVQRVEVNKIVDVAPAVRHEGDVMIIPVIREVVVVEKKLMLVEELHVSKKNVQTEVTKEFTLRKEEVNITREPGKDDRER